MSKYIVMTAYSLAMLAGTPSAEAQTATQDINITATVSSYCSIDGIANPSALAASIPVTNNVVDTTVITSTIANVICNNAADVLATSLSGGVTPGGAPAAGTTNIINYTGAATFAGATSTIDTATTASASGSEAGNTAATSSAASGNLVVTITPAQPSLPLMASASYADTLRVTLTSH